MLDANDNAPYFVHTAEEQSVSADFPAGFPIVTLLAKDDDLTSELLYDLSRNSYGNLGIGLS